MIKLYVGEVVSLVRKNMDEVDTGVEAMLDQPETLALNDVIRRTLPEAINAINKVVPADRLQGIDVRSLYQEPAQEPSDPLTYNSDYEAVTIDPDGRVSFTLDKNKLGPWLRLVGLKALDSAVVLTDVTPEASAEGRKQLNPYVRGRYDDPRLVGLQGSRLRFIYYSLREETITDGGDLEGFDLADYITDGDVDAAFPFDTFTFMPECELEKGRLYVAATQEVGAHYLLSDGLMDAVINQLSGMMMTIFGQTEKSKIYFDNIKF